MINREVSRVFTVGAEGLLQLETTGSISIVRSDDERVTIVARHFVHAENDAEADEVLKGLRLTIQHNGSTVSGLAKYVGARRPRDKSNWPPVRTDFAVKVPAGFGVELGSSGGSIDLCDLKGNVRVQTGGGALRMGRVRGTVDARTSGGSAALVAGEASVTLLTSGGRIEVGRIAGLAHLVSSGGEIRIDALEDSLFAVTQGGPFRAGFNALKRTSSVSTDGGCVQLLVGSKVACNFDVHAGADRIDSFGLHLFVTKNEGGKARGRGLVNGGGPTLTIRAGPGPVEMSLRE